MDRHVVSTVLYRSARASAVVVLAAVAVMMMMLVEVARAQGTGAADGCFPGIGCLDKVQVSAERLKDVDCNTLANMREALSAKRPQQPRTVRERANLRMVARFERQKKCFDVAAKPKPPSTAAEQPRKKRSTPKPSVMAAPAPAPEPAVTDAAPEPVATDAPDGSAGAPAPAEPPAFEVVTEAPPPPDAATGAPAEDLGYTTQTVFYATDRKPTGDPTPNDRYGPDRGDMVLGSALVSIPKDHRVGELEAPSIFRLEFSEDPTRHVVLLSVDERNPVGFYADVTARVRASAGRSAFIFVHGYNVTFRDAARRTAQMAYDLQFDGAPAFFSWPSQGTTLGYSYDEGNVEWAVPDLKRFIAEFAAKSEADNLFLVGHSMGTRALTAALKELFQEDPQMKTRIREVILAAPDIDADVFKRSIAPAFQGTDLVTLYASSKDLALTLSRTYNGHARAGDSGAGLVVVPGVDTIEASDVATDFIGHAYFGASTSIIKDIYQILRGRRQPENRPHLKPVTDQLGAYWKFQRTP